MSVVTYQDRSSSYKLQLLGYFVLEPVGTDHTRINFPRFGFHVEVDREFVGRDHVDTLYVAQSQSSAEGSALFVVADQDVTIP